MSRLKLSEMLSSRFTGDPSAWIVQFKDYVSLHRLEGSEILERMKYCTEGNARKWVDSLDSRLSIRLIT